jgi:N-methylhydantoinase A
VYRALFGRVEAMPLEVISWRVVVSGPVPQFSLNLATTTLKGGSAQKGQRLVYFGEADGFTNTPVYDRTLLENDYTAFGPAIVEERESTLVVPPGFTMKLQSCGNLIVDKIN